MSEVSFDELFILGKHHVGYQPAADVFPDGMHSFELFGSLENGMAAYPDIPKEQWDEYDFSDGWIKATRTQQWG